MVRGIPKIVKIICALKKKKSLNMKSLGAITGCKTYTIRVYVQMLEDSGLVRMEKLSQNNVMYHYCDNWEQMYNRMILH